MEENEGVERILDPFGFKGEETREEVDKDPQIINGAATNDSITTYGNLDDLSSSSNPLSQNQQEPLVPPSDFLPPSSPEANVTHGVGSEHVVTATNDPITTYGNLDDLSSSSNPLSQNQQEPLVPPSDSLQPSPEANVTHGVGSEHVVTATKDSITTYGNLDDLSSSSNPLSQNQQEPLVPPSDSLPRPSPEANVTTFVNQKLIDLRQYLRNAAEKGQIVRCSEVSEMFISEFGLLDLQILKDLATFSNLDSSQISVLTDQLCVYRAEYLRNCKEIPSTSEQDIFSFSLDELEDLFSSSYQNLYDKEEKDTPSFCQKTIEKLQTFVFLGVELKVSDVLSILMPDFGYLSEEIVTLSINIGSIASEDLLVLHGHLCKARETHLSFLKRPDFSHLSNEPVGDSPEDAQIVKFCDERIVMLKTQLLSGADLGFLGIWRSLLPEFGYMNEEACATVCMINTANPFQLRELGKLLYNHRVYHLKLLAEKQYEASGSEEELVQSVKKRKRSNMLNLPLSPYEYHIRCVAKEEAKKGISGSKRGDKGRENAGEKGESLFKKASDRWKLMSGEEEEEQNRRYLEYFESYKSQIVEDYLKSEEPKEVVEKYKHEIIDAYLSSEGKKKTDEEDKQLEAIQVLQTIQSDDFTGIDGVAYNDNFYVWGTLLMQRDCKVAIGFLTQATASRKILYLSSQIAINKVYSWAC